VTLLIHGLIFHWFQNKLSVGRILGKRINFSLMSLMKNRKFVLIDTLLAMLPITLSNNLAKM